MKVNKTTLVEWQAMAQVWLRECAIGHDGNYATPGDISLGRDAWMVAHRAGITNQAYAIEGIHAAHIQTALRKIFPKAVFRDKL